jgi:sugar/nucleoside kinase (ribokinase family)
VRALDGLGHVRGALALIETRGPEGATLHFGGRAHRSAIPTDLSTPVVDTTGAGDAFAAGVLARLPSGAFDVDAAIPAMALGHRAARIVIGDVGAEVTPELRYRLQQETARQYESQGRRAP